MLTVIQAAHVQKVFPDCRAAMEDFLSRGLKVFVAHQNECGADVPPYAIRVVDQPEFWIDCARSERAATQLAKDLDLQVTKRKTV